MFFIDSDFVEIGNFEYTVSKIFIHASYNHPKFANDIAIIELDRENGDEINDAVCLPESSSNAISSIALLKREGGSIKPAKAQSISADKCSSFFNQQFTQLTAGQYCANLQSNETTYTPFIGAVVLESDINRQYFFKGFTSIRTRDADEKKPYIFTDLAHHLSWIQAAIGNALEKNKIKPSLNVPTQNTTSCQMSNGSGFCVEFQQCSLYRDSPNPMTQQRIEFIDRVKCFKKANNVNEDGVCCPEKYIELNAEQQQYDFDVRTQVKRVGAELLDLEKCGKVNSKRRIVGGMTAELQEFPWIGLVKYKFGKIFKFTCGSSLISSQYVVTCAHCITNLPFGFQVVGVRLGEHDRSSDVDCVKIDENQNQCNPPVQDINIEKLIPHPNYNTPRYANDGGLIRLAESPDMTKG